ncbi:MAG: hypothetical protein ACE5GD_04560 [Candidatus Geothermarchaeales archaeon]
MRPQDEMKHFQKTYPSCSPREVSDLLSAVKSNKYWRVHTERRNALYVVALTRAKIPHRDGFKAKTTASKTVILSRRAARFARRGRILVAVDRGDHFSSDTVIEWPAFRKLIRRSPDSAYRLLVENPNPPPFISRRNLGRFLEKISVLESIPSGPPKTPPPSPFLSDEVAQDP